MNKLVSRNPVLRFKQGKKIIKAQGGTQFWMGRMGNWYSGNRKGNTYINPTQITPEKIVPLKDGRIIAKINGKWYNQNGQEVINFGSSVSANPSSPTKKEYIPLGQVAITRDKYIKNLGNTQYTGTISGIIPGVNNPIFYGTKAGGSVNRNALSNITDDLKARLIGTGKFTELDFANTKNLQTALNNYFANDAGAGSIKVDNLWGNQTLKAFDLALSRATSPAVATTKEIEILKPVSVVPTYTPPTTPSLNLNIPAYVTADRSQTRDWMRSNGINPYSVTGAMRAAARRIRAGQADDNDKLLVKNNEQLYNLLKGYYKQGGTMNILPSRNIVERFKSQRNIKS